MGVSFGVSVVGYRRKCGVDGIFYSLEELQKKKKKESRNKMSCACVII